MTERRTGLRLRVLAALVVAMFAALTTRLWFLQVLAVEQNRRAAEGNAVRLVETPARRGEIKDVAGVPLVENRQSLVLTINRQELGTDAEEVLYRLSQLLDVPAISLGEALDSPRYYPFTPIPVAVDIPEKKAMYLKEHAREFPGVDVQELPVRSYPLGGAAAQVLGYLREISADKLDDPAFADYQPGDYVGADGVEAVYEHDLVGTPGLQKYLVNARGETIRELGSAQPPVAGDDIYLTLDADVQTLAEESLRLGMSFAHTVYDSDSAKYLLANAGAVVVMNPDDGSIEAMVSYPGFQPAAFTRPLLNFDERFGSSSGSPLLNRAIAGEYPPGSTYKPWIALAALERGIRNTAEYYACPGTWITPYNRDDPDATLYPFDNWTSNDLGAMRMGEALARSCDTVFYPIGYDYWAQYFHDGHEPLQNALERTGFGRLTNVDLPGERLGRVPTPEWKLEIHQENPDAFPEGDWFPGDFINMSIGQGDTLVTPLQMATAFSALQRDDGKVCTPHVLDRVVDSQTGDDARRYGVSCRRLPFDPGYLAYVRNALAGTVRGSGTAGSAFAGFPFDRVWVSGKTGTAQVEPKQDYSWFACMTEAGGQRHVVVVLVEQGGHGSTTAAPIARHIVEGIYGLEFSHFTDLTLEATD